MGRWSRRLPPMLRVSCRDCCTLPHTRAWSGCLWPTAACTRAAGTASWPGTRTALGTARGVHPSPSTGRRWPPGESSFRPSPLVPPGAPAFKCLCFRPSVESPHSPICVCFLDIFFFFFFNNFIYLVLTVLGLCCYVAFALVVASGGYSHCSAQASPCSGFSCWGPQAPECGLQ